MAKRQMFINMIQKGRLKPDWDSDGLVGTGMAFRLTLLMEKSVKS